jgi:hypothetical protein
VADNLTNLADLTAHSSPPLGPPGDSQDDFYSAAVAYMLATARGDMIDIDLMWIAAGCPKGKEPRSWLGVLKANWRFRRSPTKLPGSHQISLLLDDRSIN